MKKNPVLILQVLFLVTALQANAGLPAPAKDPLKGLDAYVLRR